jgi:general secretion pathway protein K
LGVEFEGGQYEVMVESLNGRIDINSAPLTLLTALYTHIGRLDQKAAHALAQATLDTRERKSGKGVPRRFDAVEDLLEVPQMTYDLYAKLTGLVTADVIGGSGRVNPNAAPLGVLLVLAGGNAARAGDFAAQRDTNPNLMDTSIFDPAHIEAVISPSRRLQVAVKLADGASVLREWYVYWGADPRSGLPWRVLSQPKPVIRLLQPAS